MEKLNKIWLPALLLGTFFFGNAVQAQTAGSASFTRNLTVGSRGADVSALQQILMDRGYLKISAPTGYFGVLTRGAVGAWQRSSGIAPTAGYFGPISRSKIANAGIPSAPSAPATPVSQTGSPVRLSIPKLNVNATVIPNGLKVDGSLDAPKNIYDAGWYKFGAVPGQNGSAVITGHVAQIRGGVVTKQGIFYNLDDLRQGDKIYIRDDKGQMITFTVREKRVYGPEESAPEVFLSSGGSQLSLITCDGIWDAAKQSYTGRLVVFADRTS